ncbi:hypothetical protein GS498_16610 [Rhodococcus hoagii]|nr:hypothetical protein [Prescottella equi]
MPAGITAVGGRVYGGDVVSIVGTDDRPVARGRGGVRLDGDRGHAGPLDHGLPADMHRPVVHADDLVAL